MVSQAGFLECDARLPALRLGASGDLEGFSGFHGDFGRVRWKKEEKTGCGANLGRRLSTGAGSPSPLSPGNSSLPDLGLAGA
jgi:hypothetical protein